MNLRLFIDMAVRRAFWMSFCEYVCMYASASVYKYVWKYKNSSTDLSIKLRSFIHMAVQSAFWMSFCEYVCMVCVGMYVHLFIHQYSGVEYVLAVFLCVYTNHKCYMHTCIKVVSASFSNTYMHTCTNASIHTRVHVYHDACMHTYMQSPVV